MKIIRLEVGQMKANCFVVYDDYGECIIIDPGDDGEYIISTVQKNDLAPRMIIATHGHVDHIMAALEIKLAFNIPFYMDSRDDFLLNRMDRSAIKFLQYDPGPPPEIDFEIEDGSEISVGKISLKTIHTPGHTPGSVCLYSKSTNDLFVGDLIFTDGSVGRTDFQYSNQDDLVNSIRQILDLPDDTNVHAGHDESFLLSDFKIS